MAKKILARVLAGLPQLQAACNDLIEGPAEHLKRMAANGLVDIDPAAVAYAKSVKARVVTLTDEGLLAAQELGTGAPASDAADSGDDSSAGGDTPPAGTQGSKA